MRPRRGTGDEGLAIDLLPLAEIDIEPAVDAGRIADLLIAARVTTDVAERDRLLAEAQRLAEPNSLTRYWVERRIGELGGTRAPDSQE